MGDSCLLLVMRYSWNLAEVKEVAFIDTEGLGMHQVSSITREITCKNHRRTIVNPLLRTWSLWTPYSGEKKDTLTQANPPTASSLLLMVPSSLQEPGRPGPQSFTFKLGGSQ